MLVSKTAFIIELECFLCIFIKSCVKKKRNDGSSCSSFTMVAMHSNNITLWFWYYNIKYALKSSACLYRFQKGLIIKVLGGLAINSLWLSLQIFHIRIFSYWHWWLSNFYHVSHLKKQKHHQLSFGKSFKFLTQEKP